MRSLRVYTFVDFIFMSPILLVVVARAEDYYRIGAIFDKNSTNLKFAFEKQIGYFNNQREGFKMEGIVEELDATDSFAVSNAICSLIVKGVYGIIGVSNASALSTIQSYSNKFRVPFVTISMTQNATHNGHHQVFMRPVYIEALLDVIVKFGWEKILYIYDTDDGLLRLQQLFQAVNVREHTLDIDVKRIQDSLGCFQMLKDLIMSNEKADIRVFLDIPTERAQDIIITVKDDPTVPNHRFHFLLGGLRFDEMDLDQFRNGGINVTGFQLIQYDSSPSPQDAIHMEWKHWDWPRMPRKDILPLDPALVMDAVALFSKAIPKYRTKGEINMNMHKNQHQPQAYTKCSANTYTSNYNGTVMVEYLKEIVAKGQTGKMQFDNQGYRDNFKLILKDITMTMRQAEVGSWKRESRLETHPPKTQVLDLQSNRTRIVTTIIEPPYVMYKDKRINASSPDAPKCGIEHFEGFCVDLAEEISKGWNISFNFCLVKDDNYGKELKNGTWDGMIGEILRQEPPYMMYKDEETKKRKPRCGKENFIGFCVDLAVEVAQIVNYTYDICVVKDGNYGAKLKNETWDGMIGELTREDVDLAIGPITINSQRERVVDFTKPYMSLGISIMIKKTQIKSASVFSFMDPLSYEIWMCILFAYIGVSVVLFLVSRFSPTEWHVEEGSNITNDFTISNSLWYALGAFMQQGCDISPRSVSGRIVGSVWWFFTLIIISSYTANLAAFLTVERMLTPIESAEDLAKQTEIQYGMMGSGSTYTFFKESKFPVHERMWAYMQSASPSVFVSSNTEGIDRVRKGNYAFLIESTTNEYINMRHPCNTMKVGPNLDSKGYGIATPIGSDLRDKLTLAVLRLRELGVLEKLRKQWWDGMTECPVRKEGQDGGQAELTLENVAGIFYILVSGLILSVIIACLEFLYKSKVDSRRSKKSFGAVLRCKARLSFRGSLDRDTPAPTTPLRKSMSTYTYTGPTQVGGADGFPDNLHTQV